MTQHKYIAGLYRNAAIILYKNGYKPFDIAMLLNKTPQMISVYLKDSRSKPESKSIVIPTKIKVQENIITNKNINQTTKKGVLSPKYEAVATQVCDAYRNKSNTGESNTDIMQRFGIGSKNALRRILDREGLRGK